MYNFKVGHKVVCIVKNKCWHDANNREVFGPKYGEVLTIDFIRESLNDKLKYCRYLGFNHYHTESGYNSMGFAIFDSAIAQEVLKRVELKVESKISKLDLEITEID